MDNNYLKKETLTIEDLEKSKKIRKLFDFLFSINNVTDEEKYISFINTWDESEKNYSFFKREQFDYSKIKDFYFIKFDEKTKSYNVWNEFGKFSFEAFDSLWEYFDNKRFSVIFYCYNFDNLNKVIKAFFEKTWFRNTNKKFVHENQWKYIMYKDKMNGIFLNRSAKQENETKKWEMFFIPIEDKNLVHKEIKTFEEIKNYELYKISLEILIDFIVTIYSKNNSNADKFIDKLDKTKSELNNRRVINEFNQKVESLFTNWSEIKCMKAIIWIAIIEWNNRTKFIEDWAINKDVKLNSSNFLKYMEKNFDRLSEGIIKELLRKKEEFINILKSNEISRKNVYLNPEINCDFKKFNISQKSFAIFNNNLFNIYFDDEWEYKNKYLFDALCVYLINNIKESRDQVTYNIDIIRIFNPRYMKWVEINMNKLDKFIKDNFKTDLSNIQKEIRKILNGE